MTIKFDVKMTEKAMFDFMLHTAYTSLNGIVGVILGGITLYLGIRQTMNGVYPAAATFFLIAAFFLIGTPINMKTKSAEQVKKSPMFQKPITYELTEEGIKISQDEQSTVNEWNNFQKAVSTNTSIILYVTKVRALIFPRESLGEQYEAAVKMISTHMPPRKVNIRHVSAD
ncbi:MAG: YcxB family protein [Bariatricus sp.]|nr:YcxB family protein [Bariatricus sp.]